MTIYRTARWLVATALAVCVGLSSYVIANEVKAPAAAYAVGFPPHGIAQGNVAAMRYGMRLSRDAKAVVNAKEVALARASYRDEPLSSTALSLIVPTIRDEKARQALLVLSGKLTRRNGLLNDERIRVAAEHGDDATFFRWLSRSVLTNHELRAAYVGAMAQATARDGAIAALTPVIGPAPNWSDYYWRQVVQHPPSYANAAKLRVAITRAPWRQTEITRNDQFLALGLANRAQFDAAYRLYRGLTSARAGRGNNLLSNGGFARQPQLPPFDWQLAVSGTLGSSIDTREKSLVVSAIGGARGFAARQLVRLPPGDYRFGWTLSASAPIDQAALSARIYCAEPGVKAAAPAPVALSTGKRSVAVSIADSACRWHWVSVNVALSDDSAGVDAYFRNISLTRVGGGSAKERVLPESQGGTSVERN